MIGNNIINEEEIQYALNIIKQACEHYEECDRCPLYSSEVGGCIFEEVQPSDMKIHPIGSPAVHRFFD